MAEIDPKHYKTWHTQAWEEISQFYTKQVTAEDLKNDPQYGLAPRFFDFYLKNRPSEQAAHALANAFTMWGNLSGVSQHTLEAVKHVGFNEDVWDKLINGLVNSMARDDIPAEETTQKLEEYYQRVIPSKSRLTLLHSLSVRWFQEGLTDKARQGFESILAQDASICAWNVEHDAKGYLHEMEHLNIGQLAPNFSVRDIDGNAMRSEELRGSVVLLDFWASWCGPCHGEFEYLRRIQSAHADKNFVLLGVSLDEDLEALRQCIEKERLFWPHVCEAKGWHDTLATLFNITGIPTSYIIAADGAIASKDKRGKNLEEALESLCG